MILALVSDLLFTSKIRETAATLGLPVETVRTADALLARAPAATVVIVHLIAHGLDAAPALRALRAAAPTARLVAFGPHTAEDLLASARAAGADAVLTHGQLAKQLPSLLGQSR